MGRGKQGGERTGGQKCVWWGGGGGGAVFFFLSFLLLINEMQDCLLRGTYVFV